VSRFSGAAPGRREGRGLPSGGGARRLLLPVGWDRTRREGGGAAPGPLLGPYIPRIAPPPTPNPRPEFRACFLELPAGNLASSSADRVSFLLARSRLFIEIGFICTIGQLGFVKGNKRGYRTRQS
jgi:hypothetical protein